MYWAASAVLVCLMVTQARCDKGKYGFVIREPKEFISCIQNPINDICPVDHKVPNISNFLAFINRKNISLILNATSTWLRVNGGNKSCTKAAEMFKCSEVLYTCKKDYVYLDSDRAYRLCMTARQKCIGSGVNATLLDQQSNCSMVKNRSKRFQRREICIEYPNEADNTCPMRNYKVPSSVNVTEIAEHYKEAQKMLMENNVGTNCTRAVLGVLCDVMYRACTRDEKYFVSLVGKQKCGEIIGCLNATNNASLTASAMQLCVHLPDEGTAMKISIDNIVNTTPPPTMTTPTTNTTEETPTTNTTKETSTTTRTPSTTKACCGASRLSAISNILMLSIVWLFLNSLDE